MSVSILHSVHSAHHGCVHCIHSRTMLDPILHLDISPSQDDDYILMQVREEEFVWLRSEDLSFQLEFDGFM